MTEIERIKKKIESAVTVFVGQDENEQGIILSKQSLFYLITAIESQKEEIEKKSELLNIQLLFMQSLHQQTQDNITKEQCRIAIINLQEGDK